MSEIVNVAAFFFADSREPLRLVGIDTPLDDLENALILGGTVTARMWGEDERHIVNLARVCSIRIDESTQEDA